MDLKTAMVNKSNEFLSINEIVVILKNVDSGFKLPKDPFFENGNKISKEFIKEGVLTLEDEEDLHLRNYAVCNIPGCFQSFDTVFAYESHYNALHRYLCMQCKKNLPSSHLLDLHLSEEHDAFFAIQAERKPMYSCFIEECHQKFANPEERKDHCIRIHKFPSNFRYDQRSLSHSKKKSKRINCEMEISNDDIDHPNTSKNLQTTKEIKHFSFGNKQTRVFNKNSSYAQVLTNRKKSNKTESILEDVKMVDDLMESLPQ